jgi:uncharacterized cupredoxin-like copper-binding protein
MKKTANTLTRRSALTALTSLAALALGPAAHAHTQDHSGHGAPVAAKKAVAAMAEQKDWGMAGDPAKVQRTIRLRMDDTMRFTPNALNIQKGETVRLVVVNAGRLMHEIVIGTPADLKAHAEMMKKHPGMEHDEAHMAHVKAGQTGEIVWTFNRAGQFEFACLIPGHFEAGMMGRIRVQ